MVMHFCVVQMLVFETSSITCRLGDCAFGVFVASSPLDLTLLVPISAGHTRQLALVAGAGMRTGRV